MDTEYELLKEKYIELLSDESADIEEIVELIVYKDEQIKELEQEVETLQSQLAHQVDDLMGDV